MAVERTSHGYVAPVFSLRRRSVRNTAVFSCAFPMNTTPSTFVNFLRCSAAMSLLSLTFAEQNHRDFLAPGEILQGETNVLLMGPSERLNTN